MQVSTWSERWAAFQRGNTKVIPNKSPHVVQYRTNNGKRGWKRFDSDTAMQDSIRANRHAWVWFECFMDNVLVSNY